MAALVEGLSSKVSELACIRTSSGQQSCGKHVYEAYTSIGLRPSQEDRFVMVPSFFRDDCSFCGVFDGTVGDDASDFVCQNVIAHLCKNLDAHTGAQRSIFNEAPMDITPKNNGGESTKDSDNKTRSSGVSDGHAEILREAIHNTFLSTDKELIEMCSEKGLHYASSTGVAAFLWKNLLTVAHVGDSKACIARLDGSDVHPEWLTVDHKPNMPFELRRIEANGGSLAWLHGNKPYIRGGDFFRRQALGEHPKQLNYSRAFGGKDLKMYGLSAEPDISHFEIAPEDRLVLIGSDGLWDVLNPRIACEIAFRAKAQGRSATADIVSAAITEMPICGVRDNITVIAIFLHANDNSNVDTNSK